MIEKVHIREHIRPRRHALWWSRAKGTWPFFIWLLAIAAAVFLFFHGGRFGEMSGTVGVSREEIAPPEAARLLSVEVTVGQKVKEGDVIARMDPSILDAQMAVERLQAERQFGAAVARAEADLRDMRLRQAEATGEMEVLADEIKRLDGLLAQRLVDAQTVSRLRARHEALARASQLYPEMIQQLQQEEDDAKAKMDAVRSAYDADAGPAASPAAADVSAALGLLRARREAYVLKASAPGTVSDIAFTPGAVVQAGMPIVTLVLDTAQQVIGFLPESNLQDVRVGMQAYCSPSSRKGAVVTAKIIALVPEVLTLPNRVSPFPSQAYRGRRVILRPLEENDLAPGESVSIRFQRPGLSMFIDLIKKGLQRGQTPAPAPAR